MQEMHPIRVRLYFRRNAFVVDPIGFRKNHGRPRTLDALRKDLALVTPYSISNYDTKAQTFFIPAGCSDAAILAATIKNNETLHVVKTIIADILGKHHPTTDAEFWECLEQPQKATHVETIGEFLLSMIEDSKNGRNNFKISGTYRKYISFYNLLKREGHFIKMPVSNLNNETFKEFCQYLQSDKAIYSGKRPNFYSHASHFRATTREAAKAGKCPAPITWRTDFCKTRETPKKAPQHCFTDEELNRFIAFDVSKLAHKSDTKKDTFNRQLYKDCALTMYYLLCRPFDAISMHWDNVTEKDGLFYYKYTPKKVQGYGIKTETAIPAECVEIINKYKGTSPAGYVFPFDCNETLEDKTNAAITHNREISVNKKEQAINKLIRKICNAVGINPKNETLSFYAFRHTSITNAVLDPNFSTAEVAKFAGTSSKELDKTYFHPTNSLEKLAKKNWH